MRHDADRRLKFRLLQRHLGLPMWQVKGLLTAIWHFAIENAPRGDIGRFGDQDIALGIEFDGDATALIDALVQTRWLDRCAKYRLIIHDWHEHCELFLRKRLNRQGISFAIVDAELMDNHGRPTADNGGQRQPMSDHDRPMSDHGTNKPNLTQPNPSNTPTEKTVGVLQPSPTNATAPTRQKGVRSLRAPPAKSHRVPSDFTLTADRGQMGLTAGLPSADIVRREFAKFRDHEFKTAHSDWAAAWRNWCRTAAERATYRRPGQTPTDPTTGFVC